MNHTHSLMRACEQPQAEGDTALHIAVEYNKEAAVVALVKEHHADVNSRSKVRRCCVG